MGTLNIPLNVNTVVYAAHCREAEAETQLDLHDLVTLVTGGDFVEVFQVIGEAYDLGYLDYYTVMSSAFITEKGRIMIANTKPKRNQY